MSVDLLVQTKLFCCKFVIFFYIKSESNLLLVHTSFSFKSCRNNFWNIITQLTWLFNWLNLFIYLCIFFRPIRLHYEKSGPLLVTAWYNNNNSPPHLLSIYNISGSCKCSVPSFLFIAWRSSITSDTIPSSLWLTWFTTSSRNLCGKCDKLSRYNMATWKSIAIRWIYQASKFFPGIIDQLQSLNDNYIVFFSVRQFKGI